MSTEITVALIALFGTTIGTGGGILMSSKLTIYRIEQLENKMDKHNGLMERMFKMEERVSGIENDVSYIRRSD
ncbi:MAG: hypothetical protein RBR71_01315 [Gudongella sp.]|nr:hypothetical protein [Gudongella sp.]